MVTVRSVSVLLAQFVPFARQTAWPWTKRLDPEAVLKPNQPVEVPLVKETEEPKSVVAVAAVAVRAPNVDVPETFKVVWPALVAKRLVEVTAVAVRDVIVPVVARKLFAKRFVEVVFVPVALVQVMFESARGAVRVRFAIVALVAPKFVAKLFVDVALVEVTSVKTPVEGVVAPIVVPLIDPPEIVAFDEMSVGAVSVLMMPESAFNVVPLAVTKLNDPVEVPLVKERFVMAPFVELRLVMVPFVVKKFVVVALEPTEFVNNNEAIVAFVAPKLVAKPLVDVTLVPVAFVKVTPSSEELPPIVKAPVTLRSEVIANAPVDVPPANWMAFVVVFPAFVTVWKFGEVPDGQFVPLARQTFWPFTSKLEPDAVPKVKEEPNKVVAVAFVAVRLVDERVSIVPFDEVRFVTVPLVARKLAPVAETNESDVIEPLNALKVLIEPFVALKFVAKRFVDVVFVPVAFVHVRFEIARGAVNVRFAIVAFVAPKFVTNSFVVVAFVEVTFVKTPVEGVVAPMAVPLIDPPLIVTLDEMRVGAVSVLIVPDSAFNVVPVAVAKLKKLVEVPFVKERFVTVPLVEFKVVAVPFVVKKFVVVAFVPTEFVKNNEAIVPLVADKLEPVADTNERDVIEPFVAPKLVAKPFVEVTLVPVALVNVTPWSDELPPIVNVPVTDRFEVIANAPVDVPPAN